MTIWGDLPPAGRNATIPLEFNSVCSMSERKKRSIRVALVAASEEGVDFSKTSSLWWKQTNKKRGTSFGSRVWSITLCLWWLWWVICDMWYVDGAVTWGEDEGELRKWMLSWLSWDIHAQWKPANGWGGAKKSPIRKKENILAIVWGREGCLRGGG